MKLFRNVIPANKLKLVAPAASFRDEREPPLIVGDYARLNSGSPKLLVVDTAGDDAVTVAWRDSSDEVRERVFPRICLRRL
jgi:hypothetical protein